MLAQTKAISTLPAEDVQRATTFYTEVLGLKKIDLGFAQNENFPNAAFEAGEGSTVFIYQRERTKAEHTALTFIVDNVEETVNGLIAKGVTFEQYDFGEIKTNELGIVDMEGGRSAWLTDPEGNIISIAQV
jgi:predicted enzyme related to lactoylglutathione lyase